MRSRYYRFGGQPLPYAGQWYGYPSILTRNAAETRAMGAFTEYLPARPSGPEPLDPGAMGLGFLEMLSDNEKRLALVAAVGLGAFWFLKRRKRP
jgi:hypothetical protein